MSSTSSIGQLDTQYLQMINSLMEIERQPLVKLQEARDSFSVRKGIYSDLKREFDTLQSSIKALISTDASYAFNSGRKVSTLAANSATVLTASASSSAAPASYSIHVTSLARAHRAVSDKQASMSADLGKTGTILVGGAGTVSGVTANATAAGFTAAAQVAAGQNEFSSGDYYVETQQTGEGVWQFRMVNASGNAVSIRGAAGDGSYTAEWQDIPAGGGAFDTGRGLSITLAAGGYAAASKDSGAAKAAYTAGRVSIAVNTSDSLIDMAGMINKAAFPAGKEIVASVVDAQLILTAKNTGTDYTVSASDASGSVLQELGLLQSGAFKNERAAVNARFTVNDLGEITRSSNTNLTDVINGVTINLASDAEGKDVSLDINADSASETTTLNTFVSAFNSMTTYLGNKLATVKQADGTYKRGSLSGDNSLYSLRMDLLRQINADAVNSGALKNLSQIGLTLDNNLKLSVSDAGKLSEALKTNKANVTYLVDAVMNKINTKVGRFTGTDGYVENLQESLEEQVKFTNSQIDQMNERLKAKETSLFNQFAQAQTQITEMLYTQQRLAAMFNSGY